MQNKENYKNNNNNNNYYYYYIIIIIKQYTKFTIESKQGEITMNMTIHKFLNILNKLQFKKKFSLKRFQSCLIPTFICSLGNKGHHFYLSFVLKINYKTEFLSPQQQTFLGFTGLFIIPPAFLMCVLNISALIGRNFLPKSSLLTKKKLSLIDMFVFLKSLK